MLSVLTYMEESMPLINWSDDLSVGIMEIDNQHKKLIDIINRLNDAMKTGQGAQAVGGILQELVAYTREHFSNEEKYFEKFGYEKREEHVERHEEFVERIELFRNNFAAKKLGLSTELFMFLRDWLVKHIKVEDQKYKSCFLEHGVK